MNHITFARLEAAGLRPSPFEIWADEAEEIFGKSLDGDQEEDGYSMNSSWDAWNDGQTAQEYIDSLGSSA